MTPHPPKSISISNSISIALLLLLAAATPASTQSPPPHADWQTFRTEHFRVTYQPELRSVAVEAVDAAERTYAVLRDELGDPPPDVIDVLVTDHTDFSNGFASIFPSSRITVYARPPTSMPQLAWSGDWIQLVVAHELVHIFHLTESGPVGHAARSVFGRVPMIWPVFPVAGSPTWNVEGLATYYESRLTGSGRVPGSFHEMIVRTAALEDRIPDLDEVSAPDPAWPGGQRSYGYGSRLMQHVADRFGPEAHRSIVEHTGGSLRPTFLAYDHVAEAAVGEPFDDLYDDWRTVATRAAEALAGRLRDAGLTPTESVAGRGPYAAAPRVSPDGRRLSFAAHDFRSDPATRVVDLATGEVRTLARRNQFGGLLGPAAWLPDGSGVILAQLELDGRYGAFSDLWRVDMDGREQRVTRRQRMAQPHVAPDGRRVAAVRSGHGALDLVIHDLTTGETRTLLEAAPGDAFDAPRWSPDGRSLAVGRETGGRVDVAIVDVASGGVTALTEDDALDLGPVWSPDGEWVLWWSDRTGIPNIMAARATGAGGAGGDGSVVVHQVTNLLTGGFDPEVSPDGQTLYLSVYHHDGWRIEALPFEPDSWRPAPANVMRFGPGLLDDAAASDAGAGDAAGNATSYSSWPTLRPYHWLPEWVSLGGTGGALDFLGFHTRGRDLVVRHEWSLTAAVDPGSGRVNARAAWVYRGLGSVDIELSGQRGWRYGTAVPVSDGDEAIWERIDRATADLLFWRPRWRSTAWLRLGTEVERRRLEAHDLSEAELRAEGWLLDEQPTLVGISGGPGYSNARTHAFSISAEDGIAGSFSVGRWWDAATGVQAYDEGLGRVSGYLGLPVGGFADHVMAVRAAGLFRDGPVAPVSSIGGTPGGSTSLPGGAEGLVGGGFASPSFFPVRGFGSGARAGTRAWTLSGEWRFPVHRRNAPGGVLGFSLTALSGSVFGDIGHAWCPAEVGPTFRGCSALDDGPLASAGAELVIDFGAFHSERVVVRAGVAQPVRGPGDEPSFYLSLGRAF